MFDNLVMGLFDILNLFSSNFFGHQGNPIVHFILFMPIDK